MTCLHSLTNLYAKMTLFARRLSSPDKSRQNVATFFRQNALSRDDDGHTNLSSVEL